MTNQSFGFLITTIIIGIIVVFGFMLVGNTTRSIEDIKLIRFANSLKNDIEQTSALKASRYLTYDLPAIAKRVIILDLGSKDSLLKDNEFISKNPIIYDALESQTGDNLYIFDENDAILDSFNIGDIIVGQFGDERCSGIAIIDMVLTELKLRVVRKSGGKMFIGEECEGLKYSVFRGPFSDDIYPDVNIARITRTVNDQRITLRKNYDGTYISNGTGFARNFDINGDLDRIFFQGFVPEGTDFKMQIGFDGNYSGPDGTNETYYTYTGQYITTIVDDYDNVDVKFIFFSNEYKTKSPYIDLIKLSYYEDDS